MQGLRALLTFSIAGTALVIAVFISGAVLFNATNSAKEQAHLRLSDITDKNSLRIEQKIQQARQQTEQLISIVTTDFDFANFQGDQALLSAHEEKITATFSNSVLASPMKSGWIHLDPRRVEAVFHLSFYKDKEGRLLRSPVYNIAESEYIDDDWFRLAMERGAVWTKPFYWKRWDTRMITYSKRVEADGQIIGVAGSDFFLDDFTKELSAIKVYETGFIALVDRDFDVLYHPDSEIKNLQHDPLGVSREVAAIIVGDTDGVGIIEYGKLTERKVLSYKKLSNGWYLIVVPNPKEIYAQQHSLINLIVVISVAGVVLAVLLALVVGKVVANPFDILIQKLKTSLQEQQEMVTDKGHKREDPSIVRLLFQRARRPVYQGALEKPETSVLWSQLTVAEQKVFRLLCRQLPDAEIAEALFVSRATVKFHVRNILHKAGAANRGELLQRIENKE
jgi:methyl-accepting chemotaxis protein